MPAAPAREYRNRIPHAPPAPVRALPPAPRRRAIAAPAQGASGRTRRCRAAAPGPGWRRCGRRQRGQARRIVQVVPVGAAQLAAVGALEGMLPAGQVLAVEQIVARQVGDAIGARQAEAGVQGLAEPFVAFEAQAAQARVARPGGEYVPGIVLAAVVDDDGFPIVRRLRQQAAEGAWQEGGLLEGGRSTLTRGTVFMGRYRPPLPGARACVCVDSCDCPCLDCRPA